MATASDGKDYLTLHYNLDMIIAIGYGIHSAKATQFRIWATKILKEYIVKGFAMDDERLKDPSKNQYFRELLERVKEIRASEKLFYQQVKDIYTTAIDYEEKKNTQEVNNFFAGVQNKLHYAITGKTAAELIVARHNIDDNNFGLTNWEGSIVRSDDICIAKNYYTEKELKLLKLLINSLLDHLELQSQLQIAIKLQDWIEFTDNLIIFNKMNLLQNKGSISKDSADSFVRKKYKLFDAKRKEIEKEMAAKEAIEDLKKITKEVKEIITKKQIRKTTKTTKEKSEEERIIEEIQKDSIELQDSDFDASIDKVIKFKK